METTHGAGFRVVDRGREREGEGGEREKERVRERERGGGEEGVKERESFGRQNGQRFVLFYGGAKLHGFQRRAKSLSFEPHG